ncbi:tRNA-dihydrouridine synthase [Candidatus Fermentibacteria bacterium]|nr:tRNA-dihydrouridine synthase [Candidatus Fermentibacteria bacterium]
MQTLTIGPVTVPGAVIMAPMAGVGNSVFRQIAREQGAGMVVTPLISAEGVVRGDGKTLDLAVVRPEEQPCAVQIFGDDPMVMARSARFLEAQGAQLIDINAGCPSKRVTACGAGVRLLRDMERLYAVAAAVVQAVSIPVTAKTRLGWSHTDVAVIPAVQALTRAGIAAIAIHARFKGDGPSTPAQWEWIGAAVSETSCPVIGNGGIMRPEDARDMIQATGCAGVMVGRAAVGRPWLLGLCQRSIDGEEPVEDPPLEERLEVGLRHLALQAELDPPGRMVHLTAGAMAAYLRGFPHARAQRYALMHGRSYEELEAMMRSAGRTSPEGAEVRGVGLP